MLAAAPDLATFCRGAAAASLAHAELVLARCDGVLWCLFPGFPSRETVAVYIAALDALPTQAVQTVVADFSELERLDVDAFSELLTALDARRATLAQTLQREIVVHPKNIAGALVAGFHAVLQPTWPVELVSARDDVRARVEFPLGSAELDALKSGLLGTPDWLRQLRAALRSDVAQASLQRAAKHLGMSTRTLQRQLQGASCTFSDEVDAARLELADARLKTSRVKIMAIAAELGFSTAEHFTEWYKRHRGAPPSANRE